MCSIKHIFNVLCVRYDDEPSSCGEGFLHDEEIVTAIEYVVITIIFACLFLLLGSGFYFCLFDVLCKLNEL